jgi:predicted  nucleic acid-binding Zn-ribbon protein
MSYSYATGGNLDKAVLNLTSELENEVSSCHLEIERIEKKNEDLQTALRSAESKLANMEQVARCAEYRLEQALESVRSGENPMDSLLGTKYYLDRIRQQ